MCSNKIKMIEAKCMHCGSERYVPQGTILAVCSCCAEEMEISELTTDKLK